MLHAFPAGNNSCIVDEQPAAILAPIRRTFAERTSHLGIVGAQLGDLLKIITLQYGIEGFEGNEPPLYRGVIFSRCQKLHKFWCLALAFIAKVGWGIVREFSISGKMYRGKDAEMRFIFSAN